MGEIVEPARTVSREAQASVQRTLPVTRATLPSRMDRITAVVSHAQLNASVCVCVFFVVTHALYRLFRFTVADRYPA